MRALGFAIATAGGLLVACGSGHGDDIQVTPDAGPPAVTTELCTYEPLAPTAGTGGTVTAGPLTAGAAERILDVPVGTALGGYTERAGFLGGAHQLDSRAVAISGVFSPSVGVEAAPRAKALALAAGGETVVIVKLDAIFVYEGMLFDLETRLGPTFAGKVLLASSHSHSSWAQFTGHGPLKLGAGEERAIVYRRFLDAAAGAAQDALAAMRPAKLGVSFDRHFDPTDQVNHDRRGENDMLAGGNVKDDHLYLVRVDGTDGTPIAALPIFGEHGTLNDADNAFASSDAPGALERVMQEQFDSKVVVMHLQSAGGDNAPTGHGGLDCNAHPGAPTDPCLRWAVEEGHGRAAVTALMTAYAAAGTSMVDTLPIEMLSRSIELGPAPEVSTIRGGALAYAPFDPAAIPDGKIYDGSGGLRSPIDEFDAPVGAALCESETAMFPAAAIPGDDTLLPYGSCLRLDVASTILGPLFDVDFGVDATHPVCETTRTTISALRLGDYVIGTMPGELTVMLASYLRSKSPADEAHTILVGYAQGHVGYMLRPEDWMLGGYEPSVTFGGPLQAESIGERLLGLLPLALTPLREDGTTAGTTRVATKVPVDVLPVDDPAPGAGTVPTTIPDHTWARTGPPVQAQPAAQIPRVSGIAQFVWLGDDPQTQTPRVLLERETATQGTFAPVTRRSGRLVEDQELVVAYTPNPLQRGTTPQQHVWVVEWQAVPWLGEAGLDALGARAGVPLGTYRFHVTGKSWTLDSAPFEVVAGGLLVRTATPVTAGHIAATVALHAPQGWRLLDMDLPSNQPVPLRSAAVTVDLLDANGAVKRTAAVSTDANGGVEVAPVAGATQLRVTDGFGNSSTLGFP